MERGLLMKKKSLVLEKKESKSCMLLETSFKKERKTYVGNTVKAKKKKGIFIFYSTNLCFGISRLHSTSVL